jgi:predicted RNA polymerase sigma factor
MNLALFALQHDARLDDAMKWINISLAYEENYFNLRVKAQLLAKAGKKQEAIQTMEHALALASKMSSPPFDLGDMKKKLEEWKKG